MCIIGLTMDYTVDYIVEETTTFNTDEQSV